MSPLKVSSTWIFTRLGPSGGSWFAEGSYLCTVMTALRCIDSPPEVLMLSSFIANYGKSACPRRLPIPVGGDG
jgi:hypothetical protein